MNSEIAVTPSKKMLVIGVIVSGICFIIFGAVTVFSLIGVITPIDNDYFIVSIVSFVGGCLFLIGISSITILAVYGYKNEIDIYSVDGVSMYMGKRLKVHIPYKDIVSIVEGPIGSFTIFCKDWTKKANGKKGPKTFVKYYTKENIHHIKQIIANRYFHINFK